ncbi:hypothetical protein FQN50_008700 [Emmonsiellopsis sp. PD_5]|nr:hypothetical protein FQN50_008700 [Emmonsiellopsis sp. PD_5]
MPRPKKDGAPEPKRRSRNGCWPCKARKIKCGEEKPFCLNCHRQGETCDYSIRLNWEGRVKRKSGSIATGYGGDAVSSMFTFASGHQHQNFLSVGPAVPSRSGVSGPHFTSNDSQLDPIAYSKHEAQTRIRQQPPSPGPSLQNTEQSNPVSPFSPGEDWTPLQALGTFPPPTEGLVKKQPHHVLQASPNDVDHSGQRSIPVQPNSFSYPSPSDSAITSPPTTSPLNFSPGSYPQPLSYLRQTNSSQPPNQVNDMEALSDHPVKRRKSNPYHPGAKTTSCIPPNERNNNRRFSLEATLRHSIPISSSKCSSDGAAGISPDYQRVSVTSLLSKSTATASSQDGPARYATNFSMAYPPDDSINYGVDCGNPDLDLNRNNDSIAMEHRSSLDRLNPPWNNDSGANTPDSDMDNQRKLVTAFSKGGYYTRPVPVNIPRYLTPLPSTLLQNPINLLYFHHFINHTGRILVPHDCPRNPFICVLPAMAVEDTNLLNLLLAYSASHRARLLGHAEPSNRIAHWARHVFPTLRHALDDPQEKASDTSLATAIMLVSLKIICPSTFEVPIPWQTHLKLARELFISRKSTPQGSQSNAVNNFLGRWLGYLDILGSLSCQQTEPALYGGRYWSTDGAEDRDQEFEIDCFSGFTPICGSLLARLSELTHMCDQERRGADYRLSKWQPSSETLVKAEQLLQDMNNTRIQGYKYCTHHSAEDSKEMAATDEAYQLAGIIHLYRRVLGKPASDPEVQEAVTSLIQTLNQVSRGGTAEVCILFPLFTAGCETQDLVQRQEIRDRVKQFEGVGMKQILKARKLMQRVWEENRPWTELANGEFLG